MRPDREPSSKRSGSDEPSGRVGEMAAWPRAIGDGRNYRGQEVKMEAEQ